MTNSVRFWLWRQSMAGCLIVAATFCAATVDAQETIGHALLDRGTQDGATGSIFMLDAATSPGQITNWGFFDNQTPGRNITPLILRATGTSYEIAGIGTSRTSTGAGVQNNAFGLVSGSAATGLGYIFGFKDGTNGADNAGVPEWTGAGPGNVTWLGGGKTSFSVGNSYPSSGNFIRTYSFQGTINNLTGETVGTSLLNRTNNDGAVGSIFIHNDPFTKQGLLTDWAFFDDDNLATPNRQVTPLLLKQNGANWEITGVGTTRTTGENGAQYFPFGLLEGSALVDAGIYLGFKDGSDGTDNAGVIDFEDIPGASSVIWLGANRTSFNPGDILVPSQSFGRSYSLQGLAVAVPEPASIVTWIMVAAIAAGTFVVRRKRQA